MVKSDDPCNGSFLQAVKENEFLPCEKMQDQNQKIENSMNTGNQFTKQKYINIETFRRNGEGVKTPVWFVQDEQALYVNTEATSGKAKRIRNNGKVNVAPCKMNGRLVGMWVPAEACELTDPADITRANSLLKKKYGLLKKLFDSQRNRRGLKDMMLEIKLTR